MEFEDLQMFIKKNAKIVSLKIDYTDTVDIHHYKVNIEGNLYEFKLLNDGDKIKLDYNNNLIDDDTDIQLELFDMFNYKNIEYIDCYILKKRKENFFEIVDMYDDYYDNNKDELICNRSFIKNNNQIKIKIIYYNNDYIMYYNMEKIEGFEEIIRKIDMIL